MNIEIIDPKELTLEEVYENISGNGNFLKIYNTKLETEFRFYPYDNMYETVRLVGTEMLDEVLPLKSFEEFSKEMPSDGWFYGYIDD